MAKRTVKKAAVKAVRRKAGKASEVLARMKEQLARTSAAVSAAVWPPRNPGMNAGRRLRFLSEPEQFVYLQLHDKFNSDIRQQPCLKHYGKKCPYAHDKDVDGVETQDAWTATVWNYERSMKSYLLLKATRFSGLKDIYDRYEAEGTIMDRDALLWRTPEDTKVQRVSFAKTASPLTVPDATPFTEAQILDMLKRDAFPDEKTKKRAKVNPADFGDEDEGPQSNEEAFA